MAGRSTFHGHREVAAKACPVYDYKSILRLDGFGGLGLAGANLQVLKEADSRDPDRMPVIRRGDRGSAVILLQQQLLLKDDGIFGPKTDGAVRNFQTAYGLERDGIVGPATWGAILGNDRIEHIDE